MWNMHAERVRTGWTLLAVGTIAGAALALVATRAARSTALPPVTDTDATLAANEVQDVAVPDDARYVAVDLDGDGTPELVALGEGPAGAELVIVEAVHHGVLARIPFTPQGTPCASDFSVEDGLLAVQDYAPSAFGDNACELRGTRHYTLVQGQLQRSMTSFDF